MVPAGILLGSNMSQGVRFQDTAFSISDYWGMAENLTSSRKMPILTVMEKTIASISISNIQDHPNPLLHVSVENNWQFT